MSERWPALMTRETAADYCDMSPEQFGRQCFVAPVDQGWRGLRWKRGDLDKWIEALPVKPRARKAAAENGLDEPNPPVTVEPPALTKEERQRRALARL